MCLILFAYKVHPNYPLVVLANRDEYYNRPTIKAHWWENHPQILAGKDLKAGGTWLGINQSGKFSALTNYRAPNNFNPNATSRGKLVSNYLSLDKDIDNYYRNNLQDTSNYNDFNLICYENNQLYYYGSKTKEMIAVKPGVHGLSNALLNTPWPKTTKGVNKLEQLTNQKVIQPLDGFNILNNTEIARDDELPKTGISLEFERLLSSMHINVKGYGTRSSNVILFGEEKIEFYEKIHLTNEAQKFTIRTNSSF